MGSDAKKDSPGPGAVVPGGVKALWRTLTNLSPEQSRALRICVAYATASITISMIYKAILSTWEFDCKFLLLAAQAGLSLAVCVGMLELAPGAAKSMHLEPINWSTFQSSIPLGVLYVTNIAVGWFGLQLVDVPMFLAIRRTATAFTMLGEFVILGVTPSPLVRTGVAVIVLGTIIAGWETFGTDLVGYAYTLGNNVVTAVQLSFAKRFKERSGVQGFGLVYYNGITALPLALLGAVLRGELGQAAEYEHLFDPRFLGAVVLASSLGCFMTYIVLLCATVNSPTVTSVTGNVKDVVSTYIGALLFPGFVPTALKIAGLAVSFSGSGIFTYAKLTAPAKAAVASVKVQDTAATRRGQELGEGERAVVSV